MQTPADKYLAHCFHWNKTSIQLRFEFTGFVLFTFACGMRVRTRLHSFALFLRIRRNFHFIARFNLDGVFAHTQSIY